LRVILVSEKNSYKLYFVDIFFSAIALFIGVGLSSVNIDKKGWGIVLGWVLWILLKDLSSEFIQKTFFGNKTGKD